MMNIAIQEFKSDYSLHYGEFHCSHEDAYVQEACCPFGTMDCACGGLDSAVCPALDCDGIEDDDMNRIFTLHAIEKGLQG